MGGCIAKSEHGSKPSTSRPKTRSKTRSTSDELPKYKITMIGEGDAGKTTLVQAIAKRDPSYQPTVGVDFATRTITLRDDLTISVDIWDTGGQERFRTITSSYYRGANGVIVLFDQNYEHGRSTLDRWLGEIARYADNNVVVAIVANKKDIATEDLSFVEIDALRAQYNAGFFNISALTGEGIDNLFRKFCNRMVFMDGSPSDDPWKPEDEADESSTSDGSAAPANIAAPI